MNYDKLIINILKNVNNELPKEMTIEELIKLLEIPDAKIIKAKEDSSSIFIFNEAENKCYLHIKNNKILFWSYPQNSKKFTLKTLLLSINDTHIL